MQHQQALLSGGPVLVNPSNQKVRKKVVVGALYGQCRFICNIDTYPHIKAFFKGPKVSTSSSWHLTLHRTDPVVSRVTDSCQLSGADCLLVSM